jgi:hypothetical protein
MPTQLRTALSVYLSVVAFAVFLFLIKTSFSPISQAQGYPAPPANTPESVTGYPGPSSSPVAPTSTPVLTNLVANHKRFLPLLGRGTDRKKGMVWRYYLNTNMTPFNVMGISWFHRFSPHNDGFLPINGQIEFVPFWKCNQFDPEYMLDHLPAGYNGYILWLNEPETGWNDGCPPMRDPEVAAEWYLIARATFPDAKFIGPHTYHFDSGTHNRALAWVAAWRTAVYNLSSPHQYPDVTGYGMHPYTNDLEDNLQYIEDYHNLMLSWGEASKELWISEFSYCYSQAPERLSLTVSVFESLSYVTRYAYWQDMNDPLADDDPVTPNVCTEPLFINYTTPSTTGLTYSTVGNTP